jgi:hypothetical protein
MEKYNYYKEMQKDVKEWIINNVKLEDFATFEEFANEIRTNGYNEMLCSDDVTGNASGSYTCNAWKAEEMICHNWYLIEEAFTEFDYQKMEFSPEKIDVTIRCYILGAVIEFVLQEIEKEYNENGSIIVINNE